MLLIPDTDRDQTVLLVLQTPFGIPTATSRPSKHQPFAASEARPLSIPFLHHTHSLDIEVFDCSTIAAVDGIREPPIHHPSDHCTDRETTSALWRLDQPSPSPSPTSSRLDIHDHSHFPYLRAVSIFSAHIVTHTHTHTRAYTETRS